MEAALSKGVSWGMGADDQVCTLHCHRQTYHRCFHPRYIVEIPQTLSFPWCKGRTMVYCIHVHAKEPRCWCPDDSCMTHGMCRILTRTRRALP